MLTVTSEKTSLRDLTIAELRRVAWEHIDPSEFVEDFNDLNFLARVNYASRRTIANWVDWGSILCVMNEPALDFVISTRKQVSRSRFYLDSEMWGYEKQYSLEFLTKHAKHLYLNGAHQQKCITPEFLEKFEDHINYSHFFERFLQTRDIDVLREFLMYKDGLFRRYIMQSRSMRYLNREALEELNQPVPDYYDTVITEQRIMSGQPCDDGQRSFTIWLRKFRRVTGRPNDYPTWNEMLTLMKSHPRLNQNGYVDWIMGRCLENTPEEVAQYPERLSFNPKRVERDAYRHITGTDETTGDADFNIEFADVINPQPVQTQAESTESTESTGNSEQAESPMAALDRAIAAMIEGRVTPQMVQPMAAPITFANLRMPSFMAFQTESTDHPASSDDGDSGSDEPEA
ncbi:hypothetical protein XbC2_549 [Xanthomonas phage XbC2]|nr:hypothetical protein XbC2_549 [Xanthomonas phage XbC2]